MRLMTVPAMASKLLYLLFLFTLRLRRSFSAQTHSMASVPDLQHSMYTVVDGSPCVRLLNLTGDIGCSNPGRVKVVAPIVRFREADHLSQLSAILVSMEDFQSLFNRISSDSTFTRNVGGILVESGDENQTKLKGFSPAQKFPQAQFSPYQSINYEWNPIGSSMIWNNYNFPVFLLSENSTRTAEKAAAENVKSKKSYTSNVAEFDLVMQTTKSGIHDSESCLKEGACLPLGGYSVWSSLPPINIQSSEQPRGIILTVASMDSASFFHDKSIGADSPISGLIALLAAVDALSKVDGLNSLSKQLVFAVFTGESWGYLGSRRFVLELDQQSDAVKGLDTTLIETILEVGSVGKSSSQGFFAHLTRVSSATNETWDALKNARDSLGSEKITLLPASSSNPGIPPSSLMAFLRNNSQVSGMVLEDFDTNFTNNFYQSHLDNISNINSSSVASAASLIARTLYILSTEKIESSNTALTSINVNASLVQELIGCLLICDPGLSCNLVKKYISPSNPCPNHYAGVIIDEPSSTPYPGYVNDVPRFVWNFLADKTSGPKKNASSDCSQGCGDNGEVCIKAETDGKGVCVLSTTRYVPAYSTRLKFESESWYVLPSNSSDPMGMVDPVWTESNWNTIGLRFYTVQHATYDWLVLLGGILTTILAYVAVVIVRAFISKALKND